MNLEIKLLKNAKEHLPLLALWAFETWGTFNPNSSLENAILKLQSHVNEQSLPLGYIALNHHEPIGMCCLRENDGVRPDLTPWLGSLFVHPSYRRQGIGEQMISTVVRKARDLGYPKLYLLAFEPTLPQWYQQLGWKIIGMDELYGHPVTVMEFIL